MPPKRKRSGDSDDEEEEEEAPQDDAGSDEASAGELSLEDDEEDEEDGLIDDDDNDIGQQAEETDEEEDAEEEDAELDEDDEEEEENNGGDEEEDENEESQKGGEGNTLNDIEIFQKIRAPIESDEQLESESMYGRVTRFQKGLQKSIIQKYHPEKIAESEEEVLALIQVVRNEAGVIVDRNHRSCKFLTDYERANILGMRTNQINNGAEPVIDADKIKGLIDGYPIALKEFEAGLLDKMFIIKRPDVNEYFLLGDLDKLDYY